MHIGNLTLENNIFLAPMAGITDSAFRFLARQMGAGLVFTEMISSEGLIRDHLRTRNLIFHSPEEKPLGVQIFGKNPETLAKAAQIAVLMGADLIDINFGCPAHKVVKKGGGSSLLRQPKVVAEIVKAVREAAEIPLTVKIRSGWDDDSINAVEIAHMVQELGVDAITIHPRTQKQGFSGKADWELIKKVKQEIKIPLIGNGDIRTPEDSWRMLNITGCDAVMVGRGALGNPWIFREILYFLSHGHKSNPPPLEEKISLIRFHFELLVKNCGTYAIPRF